MLTSKILFDRKDVAPDEPNLKNALADVYPFYKELLALTETYQQVWKFYGSRIGWQFKVAHKGKALFYLTPEEGSFRLGFAVRDKEREILLTSKLLAKAKEELLAAKRYPEGWPLRLHVSKQGDMKAVRLVVDTLKALRP